MIYFLIPVYNESGNIPELAKSLQESMPGEGKHYVFVDDCSKDDTISTIEHHFPGEQLTVLKNPQNTGPGYSFNAGFNHVLQLSTDQNDLVVTVEGDNTSDLEILDHMVINARLGYSLVLASVYVQSGGFNKTGLFRTVVSFIANMLFRAFFNLKVLTMSSFYRVYHIPLLREIKKNNDDIICEPGFISMLEILLKAITANAKILEIPMILKSDNRIGRSKMKIVKTAISYFNFLFKTFFYLNDVRRKKVIKQRVGN